MNAGKVRRRSSAIGPARWFGLALAGLWLHGCALSTPPERSEVLARALPTTEIPDDWQQADSLAGEVGNNWLASFNDPQLTQIVAEALANNPDQL